MRASDAALAKNGVGDADRADFLALFERYRDDIVEADDGSRTVHPAIPHGERSLSCATIEEHERRN